MKTMKIKISYEEREAADVERLIDLLRPIIDRFKVKKSEGTPPYKHLYFTPKKCGKH